MAREPEAIAELRCALGERLATFRKAAELTQEQLAKATFCDRSRVAHIERGTGRADERFWTAADEATRADGSLLRSFRELEAEKRRLEHQTRSAELAAMRAKADHFRQDAAETFSQHGIMLRTDVPRAIVPPALAARGDEMAPIPTTAPSPEAVVKASQEGWCTVRQHLVSQGTALAKQASTLYPPHWRVPNAATVIAPKSWLPEKPIPIQSITLDWEPHAPRPDLLGDEAELRPILPLRTPRRAFKSLHQRDALSGPATVI